MSFVYLYYEFGINEHRKGNLALFKISKEGDYFTEADLAKTIEKLIDDF